MDQGVDGTELVTKPKFVNDTIMAEVRSLIPQAAENSIFTVSVFIRKSDLAKETISIEKIERFFTDLNENLGLSPTPGQ